MLRTFLDSSVLLTAARVPVPRSSVIVRIEIAGRLERSRGHERNSSSGCSGSLPYGCVRSASSGIKHRVLRGSPQTAPPARPCEKDSPPATQAKSQVFVFFFGIGVHRMHPCLPGEGRRVAKASQGGPPTLEAKRKVRSEAEAYSEAKAGG
jgi:hypothetical protein